MHLSIARPKRLNILAQPQDSRPANLLAAPAPNCFVLKASSMVFNNLTTYDKQKHNASSKISYT
jgi:hypothetical protein